MGIVRRLFGAARRAAAQADAPRIASPNPAMEIDAMAAKKTQKKRSKKKTRPAHPTGNTELDPVTGQEIPKQSELG